MMVRLGADPVCDPSFVGPLSAEQSLICDLEAGISYRDTLLAQPSPSSAAAGFGGGNIFLYVILAVVFLGLLKR